MLKKNKALDREVAALKGEAARTEELLKKHHELAEAWNRVKSSADFKELWQLSADLAEEEPGKGSESSARASDEVERPKKDEKKKKGKKSRLGTSTSAWCRSSRARARS